MRIFYSEAIPRGTPYLMPEPMGFEVGPILLRRDPWTAPSYRLDSDYVPERDRALEHLADLLDGMCEDLGMNPEKVWREPKWREQSRHDAMRYMAHERMALTVFRPDDYVKVIP